MATADHGGRLQRLREAIDGLDLAVHGDAIAEARELLDRLHAAITRAEATDTSAGLAETEGFAGTAAFARHRCRLTLPESRRVARRAARVAAWPELGEAWRAGALTGAQVELAAQIVPERHVARFAETLADTIEILRPPSAFQTGKALRHWAKAADAGAIIEKALVAATTDDRPGERRTPLQRRADALVTACQGHLDSLENPDGNRRTERLTVTAEITALHRAWLRGAGVGTAAQLQRFLADHHDLGELDHHRSDGETASTPTAPTPSSPATGASSPPGPATSSPSSPGCPWPPPPSRPGPRRTAARPPGRTATAGATRTAAPRKRPSSDEDERSCSNGPAASSASPPDDTVRSTGHATTGMIEQASVQQTAGRGGFTCNGPAPFGGASQAPSLSVSPCSLSGVRRRPHRPHHPPPRPTARRRRRAPSPRPSR